ncbi:hypothetical protein EMIT0210MI2_270016 [Priestia megaterium]
MHSPQLNNTTSGSGCPSVYLRGCLNSMINYVNNTFTWKGIESTISLLN